MGKEAFANLVYLIRQRSLLQDNTRSSVEERHCCRHFYEVLKAIISLEYLLSKVVDELNSHAIKDDSMISSLVDACKEQESLRGKITFCMCRDYTRIRRDSGKPSASYLRFTPVLNFEKLDEIFGKGHATGSRVVGHKQRRAQLEANDKNANEVYDEFDVQDEGNNDVSSSSRVALN
ncbi:hypothetical protein M9H77_23524 [Catharanthus roseus]|uniref:Uncharacterized protein n=1 Tax=Catharanthus roseus TaxID=4058 RepID=A0ACC0AXM0_CATRO|nr:hypothetical protein M9H77_23524 [Catharanthus roseus]